MGMDIDEIDTDDGGLMEPEDQMESEEGEQYGGRLAKHKSH